MTASGPSKVVVLDPDARASRQVQLGFAREGIEAVAPAIPGDLGALQLGLANGDAAGIALVGGADVRLVQRARELLAAGNADVPIVVTGPAARREELLAAGADAVLSHPVYLRDVVTIGRILRNVPRDQRDHLVGSLVETSGVYALVRALCALGRSAVLTLIRGLRRGEIRFYRGEVTSAQVGLIHGQAAFHQLLLWTDARFDFAYEDIVRRAQIPMSPAELFQDAERFLVGVRESAELLSPSMVLEQDTQRIQSLGKQVPTEVHGVLRMFDGHRVLADILEDSPYRVFETLRVAQKAVEAGLLRQVADLRPKTSWRAVLAIEEWLVGSETHEDVVERIAPIETGPVSRGSKPKFKKGKKKRSRTPSPGPGGAAGAGEAAAVKGELKPDEIDWGALVPRSIGQEVGSLATVVPAMGAHGEIDVATRDKAREKLEALMDTDKRQRIFPTEIGLEPSVVVRDDDSDEWDRIEGEAKAKARAEAEAEANAKAEAEAAREREEAEARVRESVEKLRIERVQKEEAEARERELAARNQAAEDARTYAARVKAAAEAKREEAERAAAAMLATPAQATDDRGSTRVIVATPITVAETSTATVQVADQMTVVGKSDTATVTATPQITVREPAPKPAPEPATPVATEDEPSDGTPRAMLTPRETDPLPRDLRKPAAPEHDGPPVKQTMGEISQPSRASKPAEVTQGPSILIDAGPAPAAPAAEQSPAASDPAALVADLAAAHAAITAASAKAAQIPSKGDAASQSKELLVSEVRKDAVEFTQEEEAFFNAHQHPHHTHTVPKLESFDDLDEGYEPPRFWERVFGKKKKS